jgi:hypothetical protein
VIGVDFGNGFIRINAVGHGAGLPAGIDEVIKNCAAMGVPVLQINDPVRQHALSLFELSVAPVVEKNRLTMIGEPELEPDVTFSFGRLVIWLKVQSGSPQGLLFYRPFALGERAGSFGYAGINVRCGCLSQLGNRFPGLIGN